jgi:hypothetical protein
LILDICTFQEFGLAEQIVINEIQMQLMLFIRLPQPIYIAMWILPQLLVDWINMKSVQNINIGFAQKLNVNRMIS